MAKEFIKILQERMFWCVDHENYELAAKHRDMIKYHTTDDKEWKKQYMDDMMERLVPTDLLDGLKNPISEKVRILNEKYLK